LFQNFPEFEKFECKFKSQSPDFKGSSAISPIALVLKAEKFLSLEKFTSEKAEVESLTGHFRAKLELKSDKVEKFWTS
jgi:hypothetical protein